MYFLEPGDDEPMIEAGPVFQEQVHTCVFWPTGQINPWGSTTGLQSHVHTFKPEREQSRQLRPEAESTRGREEQASSGQGIGAWNYSPSLRQDRGTMASPWVTYILRPAVTLAGSCIQGSCLSSVGLHTLPCEIEIIDLLSPRPSPLLRVCWWMSQYLRKQLFCCVILHSNDILLLPSVLNTAPATEWGMWSCGIWHCPPEVHNQTWKRETSPTDHHFTG